MKRYIWPMVFMILMTMGCDKDDSFDVGIRVRNTSDIAFEEVRISGYAPELVYLNVPPGTTTAYQGLDSDKRPDVFYLRTASDTVHVVYDYSPEYYDLEEGLYTMEVDSSFTFGYIKE